MTPTWPINFAKATTTTATTATATTTTATATTKTTAITIFRAVAVSGLAANLKPQRLSQSLNFFKSYNLFIPR